LSSELRYSSRLLALEKPLPLSSNYPRVGHRTQPQPITRKGAATENTLPAFRGHANPTHCTGFLSPTVSNGETTMFILIFCSIISAIFAPLVYFWSRLADRPELAAA
jgi:hypothetical protein